MDDEEKGSFNSASVWGRISVVAAGPIFNLIMAFFFALIVIGVIGYDPAAVIGFQEDSPAAAAGLQEGDVITRINGARIDIGRDLYNYETFEEIKNEPVSIEYKRDGKVHSLTYEPAHETKYMLGFHYLADDQPAPGDGHRSGAALSPGGDSGGRHHHRGERYVGFHRGRTGSLFCGTSSGRGKRISGL